MLLLSTLTVALVFPGEASQAHSPRLKTETNSLGMTLVKLPKGAFTMGDRSCKKIPKMCEDPQGGSNKVACSDGSMVQKCRGKPDERPLHLVRLTRAFWMMETEVTQGHYDEVMGNPPSHLSASKGDYRSPTTAMEEVSWYDAVTFANKLSQIEGLAACYEGSGESTQWKSDCTGYRLPTEAEWECAARAGQLVVYSGSNVVDEVAWHSDNADGKPHEVGQKKPNEWHLYDMSGNVREWVWDRYAPYTGNVANPRGPTSGITRVLRGGSWDSYVRDVRISYRFAFRPEHRYQGVGFRLVRTAQ